MKFDFSAAKAYVGGILATAGVPISTFIVGMVEKMTGFDIPVSIEGLVLTGVTFVLGYIGVYFTPNKQTTS
jgi:hypothetical protein